MERDKKKVRFVEGDENSKMIRTKDVEMKEFLEVGMEVEDPMKRWCNAINIDSTNDDVTAYMKRVLTKSESRAFNQANELLGESSLHPSIHLPSTSPPRERVIVEPPDPSNSEDRPHEEVDCCVGGGSVEPVCCISQGMSLLQVF